MLNPSTEFNLLTSAANLTEIDRSSDWAKHSIANRDSGTQLVFVDTEVGNYQTIAENVFAGAKVVLLDSSRDEISQITETLEKYDHVAGVHIISHGSSGQLKLGSSEVGLKTLNQRSDELTSWSKALAPDADILLYGCDVAEGESGKAFVTQLGRLTGADIAASTDLTGSANLGGDWNLEFASGAIDAPLIFQSALLDKYEGVFAEFSYSDFSSVSGLQLNGSSTRAGTALQLTPGAVLDAGSAYYATPLAITSGTSFQTQFQFRLSGGTDGADGFTFLLQNSTAGAQALGAPGGNLGYDNQDGGTPIGRSLAIEFDTSRNAWDPSDNHVAVLRDGDVTAALATTSAGIPDLNSGSLINAWVDYNGGTDQLDVYLSTGAARPTTAALSYSVDLASVVGNQAFAGFTAATGGLVNVQDITRWSLSTSETPDSPPATDTTAPTATATAAALTAAGTAPYSFTVTYSDNVAIDSTSINGSSTNSDIRVTNAAGFSQLATLVSVTPAGSGSPRTATYQITAPGGSWDSADNGTYTIALLPSQVRDTNGNFAAAATLGSFQVGIGSAPPPTSPTINFTDFSSVSGLQLNGNSMQSGTALQLTPAAIRRTGSAYYATPLAITSGTSFQTQFQFRLSGGTNGADGFTFLLQNSGRGARALGAYGKSLGYDNLDGGTAIDRSLAIEFDTFQNTWDPNNNHISVLRDGDVTAALATTSAGIPDLNSGSLINAWVDYNGSTDRLDVYLSTGAARPTTAALSYTVDLASVVGNQAFVGFTAATGGSVNAQDITRWSLSTSETTGSPPVSTLALKDSSTIFVNEGAGNATVTVVRTGNTQERVTLEYTTNAGEGANGAQPGVDYTSPTFNGRANTGQVVFEAGETEKTFSIPILDDGTVEGNETFSIGIQNPSAGTLGTPRTALITIIDNDIASTVSVSDTAVTVSEGSPSVSVTVQRSGDVSGTASIAFATNNGTATAGSDYTATSGTLTFAAGQSTQTISIPILEDTLAEGNETFTVRLSNPTGATLGSQATTTITLLDNDLALGTLKRQTVLEGLNTPTAMDWTPDGRYMMIAEKSGIVKIADNGVLRSTPLLDLRADVNDTRDRGMLGLAVHPQFFSGNPYIYVTYTVDPPETAGKTGLAGPNGNGNRPAQLVRFTLDPRTMTVDLSSRKVLAGTNSTWAFTSRPDGNSTGDLSILPSGIVNGTTITAPPDLIEVGTQDNDPDRPGIQNQNIRDYIATDSESHTIGAVHFGPDGMLYVSTGDGTSYNFRDPRAVRVQDVSNLSGKVLRLDPITGNGVAGNPFFDSSDPGSNRSKVFYSGLRNPFRFTFDPTTSNPVIGDVGWTTWEEINTGAPGSNFGWPYLEGPNRTSGYQNLSQAISFYNNGNRNSPSDQAAVFPILSRRHGAPDFANAIVVGDFYNKDTLMFGDFVNGTLYAATLNDSRQVTNVQVFDSNIAQVSDMEMGPDGRLYGVYLGVGQILRWDPV